MRVCLYILFFSSLSFIACKSSSKGVATLSQERQLLNTNTFIDALKEKITSNDKEAIKLFNDCIFVDPYHAPAYYELSRMLMTTDIQQSIIYAKKAIAIDDSNNWYRFQLAKSYKQSGEFKDAIKQYGILIERDPYQVEYYFEQAQIYLLQNKVTEAIGVLNLLENKIGVTEDISLQKKDWYLSLRKPDKAIAEMEKLIAAFPTDTRYYNLLADLYIGTKQLDKALQMYEKIKELSPNEPYLNLSLAQYYKIKGDFTMSFEYLKKAYGNSMLDIDTKISILQSYYQLTNRYPDLQKQSMELLDVLIQTHPNEPKVYSMQADFYLQNGDYANGRDALKKVNQLDPSKFVVWSQLMQAELMLSDFPNLLIDGKKAIELFPEQPLPYLFLGLAYNFASQSDSAISIFTKGIPLVIDNPPLKAQMFSELGNAYNNLKQYNASDEAFDKALELSPSDYNLLNNYSYYLSERGEQLERAKKMAKRANELHPNDAAYLDTYGWVLYKAGEYEEAYHWLSKALQFGGDKDAVILEHVGDALYKMQKTSEALDYWQKAIKQGKGSDLLEKKVLEKRLIE